MATEDWIADLDDLTDNSDQEYDNNYNDGSDNESLEKAENEKLESNELTSDSQAKGSIFNTTVLWKSKQLKDIIQRIDNCTDTPTQANLNDKRKDEDENEYKLTVEANAFVSQIDEELSDIIKYIRQKYECRYKGLDSLVTNPIEYVKTVQTIKDKPTIDLAALDFLPQATLMIVNMLNADLKSKTISSLDLKQTLEACDLVLQLDSNKMKLLSFVESRMNLVAPNLSALVGTSTAAKLLGASGGLKALSVIPSCNLPRLGSNKAMHSGFSKLQSKDNSGFIFNSELVRTTPSEFRAKIAKITANKASLASRVDAEYTSRDGSVGKAYKEEILKKLEGLMVPPPSKAIKALPIPDEGPKKRRGGKRVRRARESLAVTEFRKAQNRMNFGEAEDTLHGIDEMVGLGTLTSNRGKIRAAVTDLKTKTSLTKKQKLKLAQTSTSSTSHNNGTLTSGFATSLAFTPVQGLGLENPELRAKKVKEANDKYFGSGQKFKFVKKD